MAILGSDYMSNVLLIENAKSRTGNSDGAGGEVQAYQIVIYTCGATLEKT